MKFETVPVADAVGAILAHAVRGPGVTLKKGETLVADDLPRLMSAGIGFVVAARPEADDVEENAAALLLARKIAGANVGLEPPFTGRCNLVAERAGLVLVDAAAVDAVNAIDEAITVATLAPLRPVAAGEMIATVKIIPFAVPSEHLDRSLGAVAEPAVSVALYRPLRVGVVSTLVPRFKPSVVAKTLEVLEGRLAPAGASIACESRVAHDAEALAAVLAKIREVDLVVVFGASAITDRRDVVPRAVELAGGLIEHLGMPVDPGNLLLLAHLPIEQRIVPVIGAPGCARSAKENGFDFVLRRLLAGIPVTQADLRKMGVGGLLTEIVSRPQPRRPADG